MKSSVSTVFVSLLHLFLITLFAFDFEALGVVPRGWSMLHVGGGWFASFMVAFITGLIIATFRSYNWQTLLAFSSTAGVLFHIFTPYLIVSMFALLTLAMMFANRDNEAYGNVSKALIEVGQVRYAQHAPNKLKNGAFLGYKVLDKKDGLQSVMNVAREMNEKHGQHWGRGVIHAHEKPTVTNRAGIYFTYDPNDPALDTYMCGKNRVKVELEVWGDIVHHENGGRAEHAKIRRTL